MSDLISRQALCDDLREYKLHSVPISSDESEVKGYNDGIDLAISVIAEFPSAEPERKTGRKFFGIVVNYPKVCTYPEYEGKPYYSIKYEENGEMIAGFGTYKPEVLSQYLREYFLPSAEPERRWIPVTEALPNDMDRLLATIVRANGEKRVRSGHYYKGLFMMDNGDTWKETDKEILAWMPLVEPYKEGEE